MLWIYHCGFRGRNAEATVVKLLCACQEAAVPHALVLLATEMPEAACRAPALQRN